MDLPFTTDAFFGVFERYNEVLWPAPVLLTGLALGALVLAFVRRAWADRVVAGVLALLWGWMAVAYHWSFFAVINPVAWAFGGLFALQALAFVWAGVVRRRLHFAPGRTLTTVVGGVLIVYALLGYPLLGAALGHRFPAAPTFGLPCPTTIFTVGLLAFLLRPYPAYVLVAPLLWSVIGASAAFSLGVREDLGLIAAGLVALYLSFEARRAVRQHGLTATRPTATRRRSLLTSRRGGAFRARPRWFDSPRRTEGMPPRTSPPRPHDRPLAG